ncbi:MAG: putative quinol monooxygenase [Cellvibrionaceae bacterium]
MKESKLAIFAKLEAKPDKVQEVADFLKSALPLAIEEEQTNTWFALQLGPSTFGIFDTFTDDVGRQLHLNGPIAAALMANAEALLSEAPEILKVTVLAAKV